MRVAAAHDVDPHRRLPIDPVIDPLQPMLEPPQAPRIEIKAGIVCELRLTREASRLTAMCPRSDDQPLQALLGLAQLDVVQVRDLHAPRVVPARHVTDRNVLVLRDMVDYARAVILPERVIVAVTHGLDQPRFVVGREPEWRGPRSER